MRKFRMFFLITLAFAAVFLSACGRANQEPVSTSEPVSSPEPFSTSEPVSTQAPASTDESVLTQKPVYDISEQSILLYSGDEASTKLIQFFEDGNIPEEVTFLYDQMGSNPEITVTDPDTILELYRRLSMITVIGESAESITDCYHFIQFKLSDDCYIWFSFEGSELWCYDQKNYSIENSNKLFTYMSDLTQEFLENEE